MAVDGDVEGSRSSLTAEPLLRPKSTGERSVGMVLFSTAVAVCGSFEFGACVGYSAPTQAAIREELGLSLSEFSIFGSILTIGAMIGAITSGQIADFIGRKGAMRLSGVMCFIGWLSIYIAKGSLLLDFGRIFTGYGIGILSYVVPVFIAEIAPTNLRGGLTTINQLMICTGVSLSYIVGTIVTWRTLVLIGVIPCIFLLLGLCVVPESPRWLAKAGNWNEFEATLQRLRGEDVDVSEESLEIKEYIAALQLLPKAQFFDLFQRRYIRPMIVGVGLMMLQQLGGISGITYYASQTFVEAGFDSGSLGTIITASIQIPITAVGVFLMDKSGRRPLLMVSATGTFVGMLLTAVSFYLKEHGWYTDWSPYLALIGIVVYMGSFSIGMGAVPWIIMSEIFPINVKGIGGSLVTLINWLFSWLISYSFNFLMALNSADSKRDGCQASARQDPGSEKESRRPPHQRPKVSGERRHAQTPSRADFDGAAPVSMASKSCCLYPPKLDPRSGLGTVVDDIAGLRAYTSGSVTSHRAVILASDVFGYEAPNLRKWADKVACAGFFVVVPDFFYGNPYDEGGSVDDWLRRHSPEKAVGDANAVVEALKRRGATSVGAAGFCWGAKVVVEVAKSDRIDAAVLLHPSLVTVDDIKEVIVPIGVIAGSLDQITPPWMLKQFDLVLSAKPEIDAFVKIIPGAPHGFCLRFDANDEAAVKRSEEAQKDMLHWLLRHVRSSTASLPGKRAAEVHVIGMEAHLVTLEKRMDAKIRGVEVKLLSILCVALCLVWVLSLLR